MSALDEVMAQLSPATSEHYDEAMAELAGLRQELAVLRERYDKCVIERDTARDLFRAASRFEVKLVDELRGLREANERAEDFRAEIVVEAFTAPDADWNTILDSLRSRIRDLLADREVAMAARGYAAGRYCLGLTEAISHHDGEVTR